MILRLAGMMTVSYTHLLHFVDEIFLQVLRSADLQHFVRDDRAFRELLPLLHHVALVDNEVLGKRDEVFLFRAGVGVLDDELLLAAHVAGNLDDAVDLCDLGCVLRAARLKELGHARQTAGDVLGLRDLARRLGETLAGLHLGVGLHFDVRTRRDAVRGDDFLVLVENDDLRMEVFLVLDDDGADLLGRCV